jgi:hypothetical protein
MNRELLQGVDGRLSATTEGTFAFTPQLSTAGSPLPAPGLPGWFRLDQPGSKSLPFRLFEVEIELPKSGHSRT